MKIDYPKITVVTPSYNQGQFLEETIQSVIGQQYPNLEYIIMDGGSTDNSVEIIRKYEHHLAFWVSEKDEGQSAAINVAFAKSTGEILAWLNSDDMYLPGTLTYVASKLDPGQPEMIFENCIHIDQKQGIAFGTDVRKDHDRMNLLLTDYIVQPSSFWTRKAMDQTGPLDQSLDFGFDSGLNSFREIGISPSIVFTDSIRQPLEASGACRSWRRFTKSTQEFATKNCFCNAVPGVHKFGFSENG